MPEINRYIVEQYRVINNLIQHPLKGFTNQRGEPATWDDPAWRFTGPKGKTVHYYFVNTVEIAHFKKHYSLEQILPDSLRHLLMVYAIELTTGKDGYPSKSDKHSAARKLLTELAANPAQIDNHRLDEAYSKMKNMYAMETFLKWLRQNAFIPQTLKLTNKKKKETASGFDIIEDKKNKIPETKVLLALGAIFHDVIPQERDKWNTHPLALQREPFICSMTALAMGAPNRVDAEQTILAKQQLKQINQILDGIEETVHYLNWQGSKGYKNYQNHILSVMSEPVDRSLEYMAIACEPARVLARFYETPSLPLKMVLGDFRPSKDNMLSLSPDKNKPTNLIHLGYLLGFYDKGKRKVRVNKDTEGACKMQDIRGLYVKPIIELQPEDELFLTQGCPYTRSLLGLGLSIENLRSIFPSNRLTVEQFQHNWIQYIISKLNGFPMGYNNSKHGTCKYSQALFSFTGNQIHTGTTPYKGASSHFAIVPLSTLGGIFSTSLNSKKSETILTSHGFSDEFNISPHQFRHWNNDIADREGIPHSIINLWSGRKTPEQLLHYVHRTHAEKAAEISDILFSETGMEITVKVVSQQQYEKLTDTPTAVTSVGFCSQNLQYSPCEYLNDFITQCTLCPSSCHAAHDKEALSLLNKDLQAQKSRLNDAQQRPNFSTSKAIQDWFVLHHYNTSILHELTLLMKSKEIKPGSVIRLLANKSEFRITDTQAKTVTVQKFALPDSKKALAKALKFESEKAPVEDVLAEIFALI